MKINFRKMEVQTSFDGSKKTFDVAQTVGNMMMYNGSVLLDIGFEDLAKEIYYSTGEVEIDDKYASAIVQVVMQSQLIASIKRELATRLTNKG